MYVFGTNVKSEVTTIYNNVNSSSNLIGNKDWVYSWNYGPNADGSIGSKLSRSSIEKMIDDKVTAPTTEKFNCTPWTVDMKVFTMPANIRFI